MATGAVGSLRDETCGDQRDYHGQTWTSGDGRTWQHMPPQYRLRVGVDRRHARRRTELVGIGAELPREHNSTSAEPARWTARLPSVSSSETDSEYRTAAPILRRLTLAESHQGSGGPRGRYPVESRGTNRWQLGRSREYRRRSVVTSFARRSRSGWKARHPSVGSSRGCPAVSACSRIRAWLTAEYPDQVRSTRQHVLPTGETQLRVGLHPATPDLILTADDSGSSGRSRRRSRAAPATTASSDGCSSASARSSTSTGTRASPISRSPSVPRWRRRTSAGSVRRSRGARTRASGAARASRWARHPARATRSRARSRRRWVPATTPGWSRPSPTRASRSRSRRGGLDATDGRYLLNRALALMWLEVRWRKPAVDGEAERLEDVHRLLSKAYPIEPGLPYPWHDWAELVAFGGYRGRDDPAGQLADQAQPPGPPIGYRRDPVSISHEGWALEIPGDFAERRTEEEWWGGGAGRSVTLAATDTARWRAGVPGQVAGDLGSEALTHQGDRSWAGADHERRALRRRGRHAGRLLGGQRLGRGDPHRVRRPERLAVGPRPVAVARPGADRPADTGPHRRA